MNNVIEELKTVMTKNVWEISNIELACKERVEFIEQQNKRIKEVINKIEEE